MRRASYPHYGTDPFWLLVGCFVVFYGVQIPWLASNADVLVYSLRSTVDKPIVDFPFLGPSDFVDYFQIYNYHLGHTLVLWLVYQVVPDSLATGIWPSGFVSAVSGAASVGLTFLIWRQLGIERRAAISVAIVAAVLPSFWFLSLVGEVYALQHMMTLLFVYQFLKRKIVTSTLAFLCAVLVSPIAGLSFTLLLLAPWTKRTLTDAIVVGVVSLLAYAVIFNFIGADILTIFQDQALQSVGRSLTWRVAKLLLIVAINLNVFLLLMLRGCSLVWIHNRRIALALIASAIPQILLSVSDATFLRGMGSFQLLLLWVLALPVGYAMSTLSKRLPIIGLRLLATALVTVFVWLVPNYRIADAREEAGQWLRGHVPENTKLIADWHDGVGISIARLGWDMNKVTDTLVYTYRPSESFILDIEADELYIVVRKRHAFRKMISNIPIDALSVNEYDPTTVMRQGTISKVFENGAVRMYRWQKH